MRHFISLLSLSLLSLTWITPAQAQETTAPPMNTAELVQALQAGGLVMIIRHERTEVPSRPDDYSQAPTECRAQRNLSVSGVSGAHDTGETLRALNIQAGRVISSPMCRSAETARYMFGVNYEHDERLMHHEPGGSRTLDIAASEVQTLLGELAPGLEGTNIALITHGGNIYRATGLRLTEGEIGVLRVTDEGDIIALGQVTGSGLGFQARWALADE